MIYLKKNFALFGYNSFPCVVKIANFFDTFYERFLQLGYF